MTRTLAWTAAVGLGGGFVLLLMAFALGGRDFAHEARWGGWWSDSCRPADTNGASSERRWAWNGGDTIDIALPGTVHFHAGHGTEVIARGSPDMLSAIDVRRGKIVFRCRHWGRASDLDITLPGQGLRRFDIVGAGQLAMDGLAQHDLELRIAGAGSIEAAGSVDHLIVKVMGSGNARLGNLATKRLTAEISGSGNVEAAPTEVADVRIAGSGDLHLRTHPTTLRSRVAGSGRIIQTAALDSK